MRELMPSPMKSRLFGMTVLFLCVSVPGSGVAAADHGATGVERMCGWFQNPSPGNVVLTDRHGDWTIGIQGDYQAQGSWPEFTSHDWITTNRHYGYGCACLTATVDQREMRVIRIHRAVARPLRKCRRDKLISGTEPKP